MAYSWYYDEQVITTPSGTAKSSPTTTSISQEDWYVNRIKVRWPNGHNGQTGIYLEKSGLALIPFVQPPVFLVGNDDEEWFDVGDEVQSGLAAVTYNTGNFPHSHYLRIEYVPIAQWLGGQVVIPSLQTITPG